MSHARRYPACIAAILCLPLAACGGGGDSNNDSAPGETDTPEAAINLSTSALLYDNLVYTSRHPSPGCTGLPPTCNATVNGRHIHISPSNSNHIEPLPLEIPSAATVLHDDYPNRAAYAYAAFPGGYSMPTPGLSPSATWTGRMAALTHNFHRVDGTALITIPDLANPVADIVLTPSIPTYTPIRWLAATVFNGRFFHQQRGFNSYVQGGIQGGEAAGVFEHAYATNRSLIGSFASIITRTPPPPEITNPVRFSPPETPTPQPWTRPAGSITITNLVRRDPDTNDLIARDQTLSCTSTHSLCEARTEQPGQPPIHISQNIGSEYAATDYRSLGSWTDASFGVVAVTPSTDAPHQFAGAYAYAHGRRYPDALDSITDIGTISWNGDMLALAPGGTRVDGTASIVIDNFGTAFHGGNHLADVLITPTPTEYAPMAWDEIPVIQGRFFQETSDSEYIKGAFYGPAAETSAGVFERNSLVGAFGATRQVH